MKNKIIILVLSVVFIGSLAFISIIVNKFSENKLVDNEFIDNNVSSGNSSNNKEEEKMSILEVTSESFEEEVLKSDKTVILDFYADWCASCQMMAPIIENIAMENEDIKVRKINIDNEKNLAIQHRVMSIPTFLIIKNGEETNRIVGAVDKSELEEAIK